MEHINQNPEVVLEDIKQELQNSFESRQYLIQQRQRAWQKRVAGDLLLLQEIFREKRQ